MTLLDERRPRADAGGDGAGRRTRWLVGIVVLLNAVGVVMVLSASSVAAVRGDSPWWSVAVRQLQWVVAGGAAFFLASRVDHRLLRRLARPLMLVALVLLALVLVPGLGRSANGAQRWLELGPLQLQPSELAKVALVLYVADLVGARRAHRRHDAGATLVPALVAFGAVAFLVMLEPDFGTTLITGAAVFGILFVAALPLRPLLGVAAAASTLAVLGGLVAPYRRARLVSFLDPWADAAEGGYQVTQSLMGLGSGGLTGVGLGASRAKFGFLPNAHTDFIYAIIGEELGLIGALTVLGAFVALGVVGLRIALAAPDLFGRLLAAGITSWLVVQAFVNIGAVLGLLPVTGAPLPFVSFGGSALLASMIGAGLLVGVSRAR